MQKQNIVCFGDSITHGAGYAEANRWTARLAFLLEEKFPEKFDVYNRGWGGNTTALALDRIQQEVVPLLPALVLIEFGINDAYVYPWCRHPRVSLNDFEKNLKEIVRLIKSNKGEPCLIINHPVTGQKNLHRQGNKVSVGDNVRPYNQMIGKAARGLKVACIDLPTILKKRNLNPADLCSEDGVHLSPRGNRIYADCLSECILKQIRP